MLRQYLEVAPEPVTPTHQTPGTSEAPTPAQTTYDEPSPKGVVIDVENTTPLDDSQGQPPMGFDFESPGLLPGFETPELRPDHDDELDTFHREMARDVMRGLSADHGDARDPDEAMFPRELLVDPAEEDDQPVSRELFVENDDHQNGDGFDHGRSTPDGDESPPKEEAEPVASERGPMASESDTATSDNSKKAAMTEEQKEKKRASSRLWHQKWESKGVPKKQKTDESEPVPTAKAKAKAQAAPVSQRSLMSARDEFVRDWISASTMPPSLERRSAALKAWMDSSVRANLMATRAGTQK